MENAVSSNASGRAAFDRLHAAGALLLCALLLVLPFLFGIGPDGCTPRADESATQKSHPSPAPDAVAGAAPPETATTAAANAPGLREAAPLSPPAEPPPTARVDFETGRAALPGDVETRLADVVAWMKSFPQARVELRGRFDRTGGAARSRDLAQERAENVRRFLLDAGVEEERVLLAPPVAAARSGTSEEARRVEAKVLP